MGGPLFLGLDLGSLTCDAVLIDREGQILAFSVVPTGARHVEAMARARQEVLSKAMAREEDIVAIVSTGYGRERVPDRTMSVTEITCHAKGIWALLPGTDVLLDIGGQDSKAIRLGPSGKVLDFAMNDRCAAGTGRFLDVMARALEVEVSELSALDAQAKGDLKITSMCTVFAETEVVSLVAASTPVPEIVRALHRAIAARNAALVRRVARDLKGLKVAMSGGVARNRGVVRALEEALSVPIYVPQEPDIVGALGAALIGLERVAHNKLGG